jgi:hypothetical protein
VCFSRKAAAQRSPQEIVTKPFLLNPPQKKPRKTKKTRKSPQTSDLATAILAAEAIAALDIGSVHREWSSEKISHYLMRLTWALSCQRKKGNKKN